MRRFSISAASLALYVVGAAYVGAVAATYVIAFQIENRLAAAGVINGGAHGR